MCNTGTPKRKIQSIGQSLYILHSDNRMTSRLRHDFHNSVVLLLSLNHVNHGNSFRLEPCRKQSRQVYPKVAFE